MCYTSKVYYTHKEAPLSRCDTPISETVAVVPNQPKTPVRTFRLADDLWTQLKAAAKREGVTVTEVLRRLVEEYLRRNR